MSSMKRIILGFSHFDMGGLQTFIVRVCKWAKLNGIDACVFYQTIDSKMIALCGEENIEYINKFDVNSVGDEICKSKNTYDETIIITFELPEFLMFEQISKKYLHKSDVKHFIYNVSVNGMIFGREFKGLVGKIIYNFYNNISIKYANNGQLLFMDNETRQAACNYFSIDVSMDCVMLLPMFIDEEPKIRKAPEIKNILTVSRADFPYKGYLMGLVEDFEDLSKKYKVHLDIVSFGPDIDRLKNRINQSPCKNNITLYEGKTLSEIQILLNDTYLYVGMGTTVLDASNQGVPSVVTFHSTMDNIASGYFYENPSVVGKFGNGIIAKKLIENALNWSEDEYIEYQKLSYSSYKENYDINKFMCKLLSKNVINKELEISEFEWIIHNGLFKMRNLRRRILKLK